MNARQKNGRLAQAVFIILIVVVTIAVSANPVHAAGIDPCEAYQQAIKLWGDTDLVLLEKGRNIIKGVMYLQSNLAELLELAGYEEISKTWNSSLWAKRDGWRNPCLPPPPPLPATEPVLNPVPPPDPKLLAILASAVLAALGFYGRKRQLCLI